MWGCGVCVHDYGPSRVSCDRSRQKTSEWNLLAVHWLCTLLLRFLTGALFWHWQPLQKRSGCASGRMEKQEGTAVGLLSSLSLQKGVRRSDLGLWVPVMSEVPSKISLSAPSQHWPAHCPWGLLLVLVSSWFKYAEYSQFYSQTAWLCWLGNPQPSHSLWIPHIYLRDVITFVLHANCLLLPLSLHLELVFYRFHTFRLQPFSELLLFFPVPCTYSCICQAMCHLHVYMPMI